MLRRHYQCMTPFITFLARLRQAYNNKSGLRLGNKGTARKSTFYAGGGIASIIDTKATSSRRSNFTIIKVTKVSSNAS
jgi:hypothetical protein